MKRCVSAFATAYRVVAAGDLFEDDDPLVVAHLPFFADASSPPRANLIPGTDKVQLHQYPDRGGFNVSTSDNQEPKAPSEREGGLPVSTQSGPGAAEAERRQAEQDNDENRDETTDDENVEGERRVTAQPVEEATANPGERRSTRRGDRA